MNWNFAPLILTVGQHSIAVRLLFIQTPWWDDGSLFGIIYQNDDYRKVVRVELFWFEIVHYVIATAWDEYNKGKT